MDKVITSLRSAVDSRDNVKGNLGGAIKRIKKHGGTETDIMTALINVCADLLAKGNTTAKATVTKAKATRKEQTQARKAARSPEQVTADKARMALVRAARKVKPIKPIAEVINEVHATITKAPVKVTHPEDLAASHNNVAPTKRNPTAKTGPIVLNSLAELDALLDSLS